MSTETVADISPELLEKARHAPVPIERDGEVVAVVVSAEEFGQLFTALDDREMEPWFEAVAANPRALAWMRAEVEKGLESIDRDGTVDAHEATRRLIDKYRQMANDA